METLKWVILSFIALMGVAILTPIILPTQVIYRIFSKKYTLLYYFEAILYGTYLLGATILLGKYAGDLYPYNYKFENYFHALAIGIDCFGGSTLYGSRFHTISAKCGQLANPNYCFKTNKLPKWFYFNFGLQGFIDIPFGANHCLDQAKLEKLK